MARLFSKNQRIKPRGSKVESTTLRGFGGGLNTMDDDVSMAPKYQAALDNLYRTSSEAQAIRWGNVWYADIKNVRNSPIVDGTYFNNRNIVCTESGNILMITEAGVVTEIWNTAIAALLPGSPSAWTAGKTQITFVPFKNTLIIHNGVDKPVEVSSTFTIRYLQDLATGSNVNVPIGKYACVAANYHCIAGITGQPTEVIISSQGSSGTFIGDPAPNDSISIDVGAYAPEGGASIRGLSGFRTYLFVHLQNVTVQVKLGVYDEAGTTHKPEFPDTMPQFGLLGQRCIVTIENDLMTGGIIGLANLKRNVYTPGAVDAEYLSSVINPTYRSMIGVLTDAQMLVNSFMVFDKLANNLMLFIPGGKVAVYTYSERLRYKAWTTFSGMNYRSAWASLLGRIYMTSGTKVFRQGNATFAGEAYHADRMLDRDKNWGTGTAFDVGDLVYDSVGGVVYKCLSDHVSGSTTFADDRNENPGFWEIYQGEPISFRMELPWIDGKDPMKAKHLRFVSIGTKGAAEFTLSCYVDNLFKDEDGTVIYQPALTMPFIGNDASGYGVDAGPYGGGRRSGSPQLFGYPTKFKTIKFVIAGTSRKKLEISSLRFLFARGNFWR